MHQGNPLLAQHGRAATKAVPTAKSAVSRVSKPAERTTSHAPPIGKSAIRQVWKPALRLSVASPQNLRESRKLSWIGVRRAPPGMASRARRSATGRTTPARCGLASSSFRVVRVSIGIASEARLRSEQTGHATEMVSDDGQFHRVTKLSWPAQQRGPEKRPVSGAPAMPDAEPPE